MALNPAGQGHLRATVLAALFKLVLHWGVGVGFLPVGALRSQGQPGGGGGGVRRRGVVVGCDCGGGICGGGVWGGGGGGGGGGVCCGRSCSGCGSVRAIKIEGKNRGEKGTTPVTTACPEAGK